MIIFLFIKEYGTNFILAKICYFSLFSPTSFSPFFFLNGSEHMHVFFVLETYSVSFWSLSGVEVNAAASSSALLPIDLVCFESSESPSHEFVACGLFDLFIYL